MILYLFDKNHAFYYKNLCFQSKFFKNNHDFFATLAPGNGGPAGPHAGWRAPRRWRCLTHSALTPQTTLLASLSTAGNWRSLWTDLRGVANEYGLYSPGTCILAAAIPDRSVVLSSPTTETVATVTSGHTYPPSRLLDWSRWSCLVVSRHGNPGTWLWRPVWGLWYCSGPYWAAPKPVRRHHNTTSGPGRLGQQRCPTWPPRWLKFHVWPWRVPWSLQFAAKTDPTTVISGPATPSVTRRHRTTGNVHSHRTQPVGTPLISHRKHRPAQRNRQRLCRIQTRLTRAKSYTSWTQENLENQWPSHLQDFNWYSPSVHNPDTSHPASITEYDGPRSHTDWRSNRPPPTSRIAANQNTRIHLSAYTQPLSLATGPHHWCHLTLTSSVRPAMSHLPDIKPVQTHQSEHLRQPISPDMTRPVVIGSDQSDFALPPLNADKSPNQFTRSNGRLINSGVNSGVKSWHITSAHSCGKQPTTLGHIAERAPPSSQQYSWSSATTGCSRLVINQSPMDTNKYGLSHRQSTLHIIPGGHKSTAKTPSSNIILQEGLQHTLKHCDSDQGSTTHIRNCPLSRHYDDTTNTSPGASATGPVSSQGPPGPIVLTPLCSNISTGSSEPVLGRARSPSY